MTQEHILLRIGEVSRRLGLSVHTIRAWERRYRAVEPVRSAGGGRLYSEESLQKLAAIRDLTHLGHGVGTVAALPLRTLRARLRAAGGDREGVTVQSEALQAHFLDAVESTDQTSLDTMTAYWRAHLPVRELVLHVVAPLIEEIGERWCRKEIRTGQEHLASGMMRRLLDHLLSGQMPRAGAPLAVAATPSGERHELGLLMTAVLTAHQGWRVHYLGPDCPMEEVAHAASVTGASTVLLSLVDDAVDHGTQVAALRAALPERVSILAGGRAARFTVGGMSGVQVLSLEDIDARFAVL